MEQAGANKTRNSGLFSTERLCTNISRSGSGEHVIKYRLEEKIMGILQYFIALSGFFPFYS